jgi:NAD(P)H-hydrate epimerase
MPDQVPLPPLPRRDPKGHKGTFGTVVVIGGCAGLERHMVGAPALTATAALRAGAGLARLVMPAPVLDAGITICPSATGVPIPVDSVGAIVAHEAARVLDEQVAQCQCLVVGPGMGSGEGVRAVTLRALQQEDVPVVVDADGLNALAEIPELVRDLRAGAVLTPHPGEYRRLADALNLRDDPAAPGSRERAAAALAQRLGCIVVLKGSGTVVSDGQRAWVNDTGGPELATGGTGDVLSGVIAGLAAQFVSTARPPLPRPASRPLGLFEAACIAVRAHGLAGESWAQSRKAGAGLLAMELAEELPRVLARM